MAPAPSGLDVIAQGRAKRRPGNTPTHSLQALKGRNIDALEMDFMALLKEVTE
jgi:hypothetical protein